MAKDLTVLLRENRPGEFARAAEALGKARVNIEGVTEIEGTVHLLVEDAAARKALESAGLKVQAEREVLVVDVHDRPGELATITRKIADAGVNLDVLYMATNTRVVISADDVTKARRALAAVTRTG